MSGDTNAKRKLVKKEHVVCSTIDRLRANQQESPVPDGALMSIEIILCCVLRNESACVQCGRAN
jgi:hypothetical protein